MSNVLPGLERWDPTAFRRHLTRGGFQRKTLESLGLPEKWLRSLIPGAAMLGRVKKGSRIDTLLRLFSLGEVISGDAALGALGDSANGLVELGLLVPFEGKIYSRFQLIPLEGSWIACDFIHPRPEIGEPGSTGNEYVMGIGPSSILLRALVPSETKQRVLELGCGIAWLSSLLASAGKTVVATDLNPRALRLAEFQVKLNGLQALDLRLGDGFAPVTGEKFDLIVSNPPYVQSPGGDRVFREGKANESICKRLLQELPDFLAPGGIAVVLINWMSANADSAFEEGPLAWIPESGVRRWLFSNDCLSPADYAWMWISQDPTFNGEEATVEMKRWLDFYQAEGTGAISGGFIVIQKCEPGQEWTRTDSRAVKDLKIGTGQEIQQILANETWLQRNPSREELLTRHYRIPEGLNAKAEILLTATGWERQTIRLTSPANLAYDGQIDENLMRLLEICGSGGTPSQMVDELRASPAFAEAENLEESAEALVRELIGFGLLIPVED